MANDVNPAKVNDMAAIGKGTHAIERTSPMGGKFIGRCLLCGTEGLTSSDALKPCPGSKSAEHSILAEIGGKADQQHDVDFIRGFLSVADILGEAAKRFER